MLSLFEFQCSVEEEVRHRDEFGWVEGCGPGNGCYKTSEETVRVVAQSKDMASLWVTHYLTGDGLRNPKILDIKTLAINAIIRVD